MTDQQQDVISPDHFIDSLLGYMKTAALKAALALDLFSTIPETDGSAEAIAERVGGFGWHGSHASAVPGGPAGSPSRDGR